MSLSKSTAVSAFDQLPEAHALGRSIPRIDPGVAEENRARRDRESARQEGLAQGLAEGRELGMAEGLAEGRAQAAEELAAQRAVAEEARRQEAEEFASAMQEFVDGAYAAVRRWTSEAEQRLADVALDIAREAIRTELTLTRDSILEIVRAAMADAGHSDRIRIRVNPLDASVLEARRAELENALSRVRGLELAPDDTIEAGCIIESEHGQIDARVETFLERIEEAA